MRLFHLLNHVDRVGNGIVHVAVDLACAQAKDGHEVWVASKGGAFESLLAAHGVKHIRIDQARRPLTLLRALTRLRSLIAAERIEIVHAHMVTAVMLARALRPFQHFRLVASVHNEWQRSCTLMDGADLVITMSQDAVARLTARGMTADKLRPVRNGTIGSARVLAEDPAPLALAGTPIVTVAGLYERKGIGELIDAFASLAPSRPTAQLYLVGEGPDRARFEAQARATSVADRIHFAGFQAAPRAWLKAAAVFVLASRAEPGGLVLPEARDCGCAIVATRVDGSPELLDGGAAGLLVPPQDVVALRDAVARLLDDDAQRARWQTAARTNLEWLTIARQHRETMAVYAEALRR